MQPRKRSKRQRHAWVKPAAIASVSIVLLSVALPWLESVRPALFSAAYRSAKALALPWLHPLHSSTKQVPRPEYLQQWTKEEVLTVPWDNRSSFVHDVTMYRLPVLIRDSPVADWPALKWNVYDFVDDAQPLPRVRQQDSPVFVVGHERDKGGMLGVDAPTRLRYLPSVSWETMLSTAADDQRWLYWAGSLEDFEDSIRATNSTAWRQFAIVEKILTQANASTDNSAPSVWISHQGVVAQCHYDQSHNFFAQLHGTKTFYLFPPDQARNLYQYPSIHYSYRQSQVSFESPDHAAFPNFQKLRGYRVSVKPGDLLYIPPYWFQRVVSETFAVSLSVLSPSEEELRLSQAFWQAVPFGKLHSVEEKAGAVAAFLDRVVKGFSVLRKQDDDIRTFAKELYETRFSQLYPQGSLAFQSSAVNCGDDRWQQAVPEEQLHQGADQIAALISHERIRPAVAVLWLQDYAEQVARWAVGVDAVGLFIGRCLAGL